ncbi:glycerophosphodiester phosphodiesterase family protein [Shouchella clausii]|nr:lamin tail domain-containing protein [Shouchella clausii]MCY1103513.1 lamin tail domain-containing protein [Shouchella clausii]
MHVNKPTPALLITEIHPDNYGRDDYEFFEIYNNSSISLSVGNRDSSADYHLLFRYPEDSRDDRPFELETITILPKQAHVFWLNTSGQTLEAFNRRYMSQLSSSQVSEVSGNIPAFSNSEARAVVIVDNLSGQEVVQASYQATDISGGFGVHFALPPAGSTEQTVFLPMSPATPGTVYAEQSLQTGALDTPIPKVVISQYMYDAPAADDGKEFVAIKNVEDKTVDLSGFKIGDALFLGEGEGMAQFPDGTLIHPGQELFLSQSSFIFKAIYGAVPDFEFPWFSTNRLYDDPDVPTMLDANWSTGEIRLANNGDKLLLMDRHNRIVDFVPYLQDITYRGKQYRGVTARADGNGQSIHRISQSSDLRTAFRAGPIQRPPKRIPVSPSKLLLITEFMYTPYFDEGTNEYVEIANITGETIDISGFYFGNKVEENGVANKAMYNFPEGAMLAPYSAALIARNAQAVKKLYGVTADFEMEETIDSVPKLLPNCDWGCGNFQMANGGDAVVLLNRDKELVDAVVFKNALCMGLSSHPGVFAKGHSLERVSAIDTKNPAVDFVEQPHPTPGKLLFGPNGDPTLVPRPTIKEEVLEVSEPKTALVASPTIIDSSTGMPDALPANVPSILIKAEWRNGSLVASNRGVLLGEALDTVKQKMLPMIEINEHFLVPYVHQLLKTKGIDDVFILSRQASIIEAMRTWNNEYRGALRLSGQTLPKKKRDDAIRAIRQCQCFTILVQAEALSAEIIHYFRSRAITIWAYGANSELAIHRLAAIGVQGIETPIPEKAVAALQAYQLENSTNQQPLLIAHRGVCSLAPENTMPAIELAAELGIEAVEIDIMMSKDGIPVVIHDYTVDRTTDGSGYVRDLTLAQLKQLTANRTDNSEWEERYKLYPDAKIPTLEEVLVYAKEKELILSIEIKTDGLEKQVADLIRQYEMEPHVYLSGFNPVVMAAIQAHHPAIGAMHILAGLSPHGMTALQFAEKTARHLTKLGMFSMPGDGTMTQALLSYAKHRGIPLVGGTSNSKASIQVKKKRGVTMIYSDYPQWSDQMPICVNPIPLYKVVKEGDVLNLAEMGATVHERSGVASTLRGGIRIIGENDGVAYTDGSSLTALKAGETLFHLYHEYEPFNYETEGDPAKLPDKWRMYSNPVRLVVLNKADLSAKRLVEVVQRYRQDMTVIAYASLLSLCQVTFLFEKWRAYQLAKRSIEQMETALMKYVAAGHLTVEAFDAFQAHIAILQEEWK